MQVPKFDPNDLFNKTLNADDLDIFRKYISASNQIDAIEAKYRDLVQDEKNIQYERKKQCNDWLKNQYMLQDPNNLKLYIMDLQPSKERFVLGIFSTITKDKLTTDSLRTAVESVTEHDLDLEFKQIVDKQARTKYATYTRKKSKTAAKKNEKDEKESSTKKRKHATISKKPEKTLDSIRTEVEQNLTSFDIWNPVLLKKISLATEKKANPTFKFEKFDNAKHGKFRLEHAPPNIVTWCQEWLNIKTQISENDKKKKEDLKNHKEYTKKNQVKMQAILDRRIAFFKKVNHTLEQEKQFILHPNENENENENEKEIEEEENEKEIEKEENEKEIEEEENEKEIEEEENENEKEIEEEENENEKEIEEEEKSEIENVDLTSMQSQQNEQMLRDLKQQEAENKNNPAMLQQILAKQQSVIRAAAAPMQVSVKSGDVKRQCIIENEVKERSKASKLVGIMKFRPVAKDVLSTVLENVPVTNLRSTLQPLFRQKLLQELIKSYHVLEEQLQHQPAKKSIHVTYK